MGNVYAAKNHGTCSACFSRYRPGQKVFTDASGKVKHVTCASNTVMKGILRTQRF